MSERLLSPQQVADWLGVSVDWVQAHATRKEPRMSFMKVGKLLRFKKEHVEEFLQRATVATRRIQ